MPLRIIAGLFAAGCLLASAGAGEESHRCQLWIDLAEGEPTQYEAMLGDLAGVGAVYLGERHTLDRHHAWQARIVSDLAARGRPLAVGLEQLEAVHQPILDQYHRGEITFEQLAERTQWAKRWRGYEAYRPILEAARKAKAPVLALNAKSETIRQIARSGGVAKLAPEVRKELPDELLLDDPAYARLLGLQMMVHASASPERLRPMIEAQIARDEAMADAAARFLRSPEGRNRTLVVICGAGHAAYGLGTPVRLRRRLPQLQDRIVLFSESGDVELSPEEKAIAKPVSIGHGQLRDIGRPIGDYLQAVEAKPAAGKRE
jgi:uncharacterized iron-regulated protein